MAVLKQLLRTARAKRKGGPLPSAANRNHVNAAGVKGRRDGATSSLKETGTIYRLMIETIRQPALAVAPNGTLLFYNNYLRELLELRPDQLDGHSIYGLFDKTDRAKIHALLERPALSGAPGVRAALRTA